MIITITKITCRKKSTECGFIIGVFIDIEPEFSDPARAPRATRMYGFSGSQGPMAMKPPNRELSNHLPKKKYKFDGICFVSMLTHAPGGRSDCGDSSARPHLERIPAAPPKIEDVPR